MGTAEHPDGLDAVVVGAGPNGLVAAATLASAGLRVLLVEAADRIGGGLRTEELTLPGFRHDVCSTVHPLALASPALAGLDLGAVDLAGARLRLAQPQIPLAHPMPPRSAGPPAQAAVVHRSIAETAAGLGRDGPTWTRTVGRLARHGLALPEAALHPFDLPPHHPVALARLGALGLAPVSTSARLLFRTTAARGLLAGLAAHGTVGLEAPGSGLAALVLAALAHIVGWPLAVGGSQSIADALAARFIGLGGQIITGFRVRSLAELPPTPIVVLDLTPRQVVQVAAHRLPVADARRLARHRYGPGVVKVDWALDGPVPWADPALARAGTVHLGGTLDEITQAERAVVQDRHPARPFVIVVQASVVDPTRAPPGAQTGWAYCHVPRGSTVDMTAVIEAQVERFAPGFTERILARHVMGPAELEEHDANLVGGDIAGGATSLRRLLTGPRLSFDLRRLRHDPRTLLRPPWATGTPGLYLASAATPPGPGVHGMSGAHAAMLALAEYRGHGRMRE
ncbi:MAG: phytoene desaturase family protein [Actinomycetes bacterium]